MNVNGKHFRTIWLESPDTVRIIDQRHLPHRFVLEDLRNAEDAATAIRDMHVRGAGLIGATAGWGMYLAALRAPHDNFDATLKTAAELLTSTRPTAVNLAAAVGRQIHAIGAAPGIDAKIAAARRMAELIADEDADCCRRIGEHGVALIEAIARRKRGGRVNILTHCNAGWLAFVDFGSATAPIYEAHRRGIGVHLWVDETRPRNQGASLTAWELSQEGVPHTVIVDNAGGHLMQHRLVDIVIVGTDRTTRHGDVANKIGTYLKALAAHDNEVPFHVALPSTSFDWVIDDALRDIPIEERGADEVRHIEGLSADGSIQRVLLTPEGSHAANHGFDITPARLVTGLITERGVCRATTAGIRKLFPEHFRKH
jgi:methylthioribose-1-phosphate isomerase